MRGTQRIIIDGYNVVYTDDRLRRLACRDLEAAREALIERLEGYLRGRRLRVTLVFDGRGTIVDAETVLPGKLEVVFSAGAETADELILATLNDSQNPRAYIVVTSDMADIGRAAEKLGCEVVGSKRFLDRIARAGGQAAREDPHEPERDYGDADYWLRKFTGGDADD